MNSKLLLGIGHAAVGAIPFLLVVCAGIAFYFLPTLIADRRKIATRPQVFMLNLFLGWTVVGWIAALMWSTWPKDSRPASE